ncbi:MULTISPECIES: autotransporter domain-containing protein [Gammaproteobacteria]|uniref:autotransporter domain-containing protein n=1 Tax=Gammaproteobacteria TaxID=1236 RepID=UPI001AD9EB36|nr:MULTISPECIES: autotransporter domain-containing protein [Gammaproteobacteria]MBO9482195.1 autotransporter domain-containing protein [Salinisphaera sp. G21_0]MBO9495607.1 autotransporter domain-containing protein [Thalassotalea sp. G20_0]
MADTSTTPTHACLNTFIQCWTTLENPRLVAYCPSAGQQLTLGYEWSWQPQVAFNYYTIKTDDYTESARDPAQPHLSYDQVNNGKCDIMELGAGLKMIGGN